MPHPHEGREVRDVLPNRRRERRVFQKKPGTPRSRSAPMDFSERPFGATATRDRRRDFAGISCASTSKRSSAFLGRSTGPLHEGDLGTVDLSPNLLLPGKQPRPRCVVAS